jgi:predicted nucleic acid-binding protein
VRKTVYIETTVPSFYYEVRTEPEMVARRNWTRAWWERCSGAYDVFTSEVALDELGRGDYPHKDEAIALLETALLLPVPEEAAEIVEAYIAHRVMPADPAGDALHLAVASLHKCDFLLTWNCSHLANANKFDHIRRVNTMLGLFTPILATPLELLEKESQHEG